MNIIEKSFIEAGRFVEQWVDSQNDKNIKAPEEIDFISQEQNGSYLAVMNSTGHCWVESAATRGIAVKWLNHEIDLDELYRLNDAILKNHKHNFIDAKDGTYDKVCVICGIRAKQAVMKF